MFCQSAIESAQNDHAMVVQSMIDNKTAHLTKIKALFSEIGAEESGVLTIGVFEEKIKTPAVRQYFEALGLDVWDAWPGRRRTLRIPSERLTGFRAFRVQGLGSRVRV